MKSYQIPSTGAEPQLAHIPVPTPQRGEVLVRIRACGLNFADLLMAKGTYQDTPKAPFTLGMEVCGEVVARGAHVTSPAIGERVVVFGGQGGLAEMGVFPAELCRPVPGSMSDVEAAGFQVAYGTSHLALTRRAHLARDERLLVLGAAGGVGLTAVEIGAALGAHVIAVARGPEKCRIAEEAGAQIALDADHPDLTQVLKTLGGVDVIYDPVGGDLLKAALKACKSEARALLIGFASGTVPEIKLNHLLVKNVSVLGFNWGSYRIHAPDVLMGSLTELMGWYDAGRLKPHVSHVLPLDRAAEALDLLRTRQSTGKVVVTVPEA